MSAPPALDNEAGLQTSRTFGALEVVAPDHVRTRVETPVPAFRNDVSRSRQVPVSFDRRAPDPPASQANIAMAKALPSERPNSQTMAQTALDQLVCFTPGACILTGQGERPIETLQVGDMVVTRDQGLRPIRWIGQRAVKAHDLLAPIEFSGTGRGTGRGDAACGLRVSPHHRMLYTGHKANMLFGAPEVLVAAKDLVNGRDIRRRPIAEVTYIHLMFDHHEVIYADGIATESFHATDTLLTAMDVAAREAVFEVFPELRVTSGRHLVPARTCLTNDDARMLSDQGSDAASYG